MINSIKYFWNLIRCKDYYSQVLAIQKTSNKTLSTLNQINIEREQKNKLEMSLIIFSLIIRIMISKIFLKKYYKDILGIIYIWTLLYTMQWYISDYKSEDIQVTNSITFSSLYFEYWLVGFASVFYFFYVTFIGIKKSYISVAVNIFTFICVSLLLISIPLQILAQDTHHEIRQQKTIDSQGKEIIELKASLKQLTTTTYIQALKIESLLKDVQLCKKQ